MTRFASMPSAWVLATTLLCAAPAAQDLRLAARVDAPLAHLAVSPSHGPGRAGRDADARPGATETSWLLHEDGFAAWLGRAFGAESTTGREPSSGSTSSVDDLASPAIADLPLVEQVRQLLALASGQRTDRGEPLSTGEVELVLTAVLPRGEGPGLPLILFRSRLTDAGVSTWRAALARQAVAVPHRVVHEHHQTWILTHVSRPRPGAFVELALVGNDLLVSNHGASLDEVLDPNAPSEPRAGSVDGDARYARLRSSVDDQLDGAVVIHVDWKRVWPKLASGFAGGVDRVAALLGLADASRAVVALRPAHAAIALDVDDAASPLVAALEERPIRRLLGSLPPADRGAVTLAFDASRLAEAWTAGRRATGAGAATHASVDQSWADALTPGYDSGVGALLEGTASVRFFEGAAADGGIASVVHVPARSRRGGSELLDRVADTLTRAPRVVVSRADERIDVARADQAFSVALDGSTVVGGERSAVDRARALGGSLSSRDEQELAKRLRGVTPRIDRAVALFTLANGHQPGEGDDEHRAGRHRTDDGRCHVGVVRLVDDAVRLDVVAGRR